MVTGLQINEIAAEVNVPAVEVGAEQKSTIV
jgi:hypothetical protein